MRTSDNIKSYHFRRDETVSDNQLSSSKRRFIENWRQNVSAFMENGNICRVTIGEVTPEPTTETPKWPTSDNFKSSMAELSPRLEMASPSLPAVKFSYCHGSDDITCRPQTKTDRSRDRQSQSRTTLPPSPNGFAVQNGMDLHQAYKRRTSAMRTVGNNMTSSSELPDVNDAKEITRKSSKLAREIYEKYNMKSTTNNTLPGKTVINGRDQYSMPWRNKTFLSLPLRFNGNMQQRGSRVSREKTNMTEMRCDLNEVDDELKFSKDWVDFRNW